MAKKRGPGRPKGSKNTRRTRRGAIKRTGREEVQKLYLSVSGEISKAVVLAKKGNTLILAHDHALYTATPLLNSETPRRGRPRRRGRVRGRPRRRGRGYATTMTMKL